MHLKLTGWKRIATLIAVCSIVLGTATACMEPDDREKAVEKREEVLSRAEQVAPVPENVNFPIRKALVEFTERQDEINHPWYIYILGMDGTYVGYFIGKTYPINACNFLSSSQIVGGNSNGAVVLDAPSLDGVYYGGGGAASNCNSYFFFDVVTNSMQTFVAPMWFASDAPLDLDVPRIGTSAPSSATPSP